jgi:hypothetical protein
MTRLEALKDLKAKVAAGEWGGIPAATLWPSGRVIGSDWLHEYALAFKAHEGSLDAAKALHEAVLPDKGWGVEWVAKHPHMMSDGRAYRADVGWGTRHKGSADTPARAWLLAILSALIAQEADQ